MPPKARRTSATVSPSSSIASAGAHRRDVAVEALADLVGPHLRQPGCAPARHLEALHELARLEPVLHVVEVEVVAAAGARTRCALAQHDLRIERHQHRRRVADRRAVGDVAAHRAGVADRQRGEAQPDVARASAIAPPARARRLRAMPRRRSRSGAVARPRCASARRLRRRRSARRARGTAWSPTGRCRWSRPAAAPADAPARSAASSASVRGAWKSALVGQRRVGLQGAQRLDHRRARRAAGAGHRTCAARRRGWAGSRCSGTGCPRGRRPAAAASAACRPPGGARSRPTATSRSPGCRSRIASRGNRPSPAGPGAARRSAAARSSTVNSALPSSVGRNWMQALTGCAAPGPPPRVARLAGSTTVQAPQSPSSQPSLVPVQRASSRSHSSTVRVGARPATSTIGAAVEEADRAVVRRHRKVPGAYPEVNASAASNNMSSFMITILE